MMKSKTNINCHRILNSIAISDSDGSLLVAALGGLCDPALYTSELLHIVQAQPDGE